MTCDITYENWVTITSEKLGVPEMSLCVRPTLAGTKTVSEEAICKVKSIFEIRDIKL